MFAVDSKPCKELGDEERMMPEVQLLRWPDSPCCCCLLRPSGPTGKRSRDHCKLSGTYYFWETWAFEYFPYTCPELIQADLGLGLVPLAWRWYRTNLQTVRRRKSLRDLLTFFDTCTVDQVPTGLVNQMMELMLGMQQELSSSWTLRAFDDQRRRRPRR
ncbi:hypothetical protein JCGZ_05365 [Jatropha curcas]|uniref:Aminotransferase-like plant mobile domain-containing protein n=1 Tax=Jatropha curcas TaxID=180498 RepID=A0A067J9T4_JATCU|nr:hypothetical protein JCGZ_05365 [Jatropha curcas]